MSDRRTASRHSPWYLHPADQSRQYASVSRSACSGSTEAGASWNDGNHVRTKGTRSPGRTVNSEIVCRFSPWVLAGVVKKTASGPATANRPPSTRRTHGTTAP
jgi:hypothetical protein